jgi:hypothetical protein
VGNRRRTRESFARLAEKAFRLDRGGSGGPIPMALFECGGERGRGAGGDAATAAAVGRSGSPPTTSTSLQIPTGDDARNSA